MAFLIMFNQLETETGSGEGVIEINFSRISPHIFCFRPVKDRKLFILDISRNHCWNENVDFTESGINY